MYNQTQEKPTAAYYVSLIGGILGLIVGIITLFFVVGIWVMIASIVVIIGAQKLNEEPAQHTQWGIIILVFSIFTPANVLGIIGGILALAYNPTPVGYVPPAQPYTPYNNQSAAQKPVTRICPQCGRALDEEAKFCPYCGKQLY